MITVDAYNAKHMNAMEQLSNAISTERAAKTYLKEVEGVLPHGLPENTGDFRFFNPSTQSTLT